MALSIKALCWGGQVTVLDLLLGGLAREKHFLQFDTGFRIQSLSIELKRHVESLRSAGLLGRGLNRRLHLTEAGSDALRGLINPVGPKLMWNIVE